MIKKRLRAKAFLPKDFPIEALYYSSLYGLKPFKQVQAEAKIASTSLNSLCHPIKLRVCSLNNFLAGIVKIFLDMGVSLVNKLSSAFCKSGYFSMSEILDVLCYFDVVHSLKHFGVAFVWFSKTFVYMCGSLVDLNNGKELNIFTDGSLSGLSTLGMACGAAAYFSEIDLGVGVRVQIIAVALECVLLSCSVVIYFDSQVALDAYVKVKEHFGVFGNDQTNTMACAAFQSSLFLPVEIHDRFFVADSLVVSTGLGVSVLTSLLLHCIDWKCTASVWHLDFHMLTGFTSRRLAALCTYLIKTVHDKLSVAVHKRLYDIGYPSVLCLMCDDIKFSNHAFTCSVNLLLHLEIVANHIGLWKSLVRVHLFALSSVLNTLANASDVCIYAVLCKGFVFQNWIGETISIFRNRKKAQSIVVEFLLRSKFRVGMKKIGLVYNDDRVFALPRGLSRLLSDGVVHMLGVVESFAVSFGSYRHCLFFSGLDNSNRILISV
ncbi:hypothetical protein G9A89_018742 [Geosiphon pyriformis]|nr:hypothetical protein G9A89_018742 [Geosiphon pyriformis]